MREGRTRRGRGGGSSINDAHNENTEASDGMPNWIQILNGVGEGVGKGEGEEPSAD